MKLLKLTEANNGTPRWYNMGRVRHIEHRAADGSTLWYKPPFDCEHVIETPDQIAAMLAAPAETAVPPAVEPLPGACVRTLPTPQGAKRFLCLPEVDLSKPVESDGWYAGVFGNTPTPMFLYLCVGHQWNSAMTEPFSVPSCTVATAAFGPLPRRAP